MNGLLAYIARILKTMLPSSIRTLSDRVSTLSPDAGCAAEILAQATGGRWVNLTGISGDIMWIRQLEPSQAFHNMPLQPQQAGRCRLVPVDAGC